MNILPAARSIEPVYRFGRSTSTAFEKAKPGLGPPEIVQTEPSPAVTTASPWRGVGIAASRCHLRVPKSKRSTSPIVPPDSSPLHLPDGAVICDLGSRLSPARRLEDVAPDYRRRPDAEREPSQGGDRGREVSIEGAPA